MKSLADRDRGRARRGHRRVGGRGCALALGLAAASLAPANALAFDRVQPPELATGHRATLAGSFANTAYGPSDVSRGGFTLPGPFAAPKDRGELLAPIFPSYSPDNGLSPWGMGFAANLELKRWRVSGSLRYDFTKGDDLTSPFGRLTRGADGNFYPVGFDKPVRVAPGPNDTFVAYHPDGSVWTFGGASARIANARGTYAWHLTSVVDAVGHRTTLTWTANASGNLFLSSVDYGGRATPQYRVKLAYEAVASRDAFNTPIPKFVDYRSGAPLALDQRVKTVSVLAKNAKTGTWVERWHYTLGFLEESVGAAFYLSQVDQTFASGESAPPVRYTYNLKGASFATTQLAEVPELTQLFATLGVTPDVVQPTRAAVIDADADGNADLELGDNARTLVSQRGSGTPEDPLRFETSAPAPSSAPACTGVSQVGCVLDACVPKATDGSLLPPRMLSQLNPTDTNVQVVTFSYGGDTDTTAISVCSRDGVRTSYQSVPTQWDQSGDRVRFVDLDADHMPDLVRVSYGRYDVLPNATQLGGGAAQPVWGAPISGTIADAQGNPFTPDAVWVSDASGDGIPDLVALYGDSIEVWHGLGNYRFTANAQELRFFDRDGNPFTGLSAYKLVPSDLNKDGLQDYFITNTDDGAGSRFIKYFTNVGGRYVETPVAALDTVPFTASAPVIATLDGSGNTSVTVTDANKAFSVALDGPGTGLMAAADDGKGTVLSFEYARGPASPGVRHRHALLATMHAQASGYDTVAYDYRYAEPTVHSKGRFLVGFNRVTRREGDLPASVLGTNVMSFTNGDDWGGLLTDGRQTDVRLPGVAKVESRTYSDASFQGIAYKRLATSTSGWSSADNAHRAVDVTTYDAYANDFCPSHVTRRTANHGTLVTQTTLAAPAKLTRSLHCLEGDVVESGSHADATFDFRTERRTTRNDTGRITEIATLGANGSLVAQSVAYDVDVDPIRITVAGKGTTLIDYDPVTKLPRAVTTADGVATRVMARDPVTDATTDVLTDRGGAKWNDFASYDGKERLASHWTDVDGSSAAAPHERYTYAYATTNRPASLAVHTLVDAARGVYRDTTELYTAAEEKIGTAQRHDAGWVMDGFVARSRAYAKSDRFEVMTQPPGASIASLDYAALLKGPGGAAPADIDSTTGSSLAENVASSSRLHVDVTRNTTTNVAVNAAGQLSKTTLVNGANATTTLLDASNKLHLAYVDEAQTTQRYDYDALGRLRVVTLPDGTHHRVTYDEYGRVKTVLREGIALVTSTYAAASTGTTELVATRTFASAPASGPSVAVRSIAWSYDGAGRKLVETNTDLTTSAKKTFTFFYDGATPLAPSTPPPASALFGLLTGVRGDGYTKTLAYRADGKPTHRELALAGFRTVATDFAYREDGSVRDETVTVKDPQGNVLQKSAHHEDVDTFGRPSSTSINGAPLATTTYDAYGRPGVATFATGDSVAFAYDDLTRTAIGFDQIRANHMWSGVASTRIKRNDRGFIAQELLGVGTSQVKRAYSYSPQGFLTLATDGAPR